MKIFLKQFVQVTILFFFFKTHALEMDGRESKNPPSGAFLVTQIFFNANSSHLSQKAKKEITDLIQVARRQGPIPQIRVLSWPDHPSLPNEKIKRPKSLVLAAHRNNEIQQFLEKKDASPVISTFNMTHPMRNLKQVFRPPLADTKEDFKNNSSTVTDPAQALGLAPPSRSAIVIIYVQ